MFKKIFIFIFLLFTPLLLTGCISINFAKNGINEGIFKSTDAGNTWIQKTFSVSPTDKENKDKQNIGKINPTKILFSSNDSQIIYLGTNGNGLNVSFNGGDEWHNIFIPKGKINDITIDSKNKNILYVASYNKIYKIFNEEKELQEIFTENQEQRHITSLATDWNNSNKIYAGTNDGALLQSLNSGKSWNMIETFNKKNDAKNPIQKILVNPHNSQVLYVVTNNAGIFRSGNQGKDWQDITLGLEKFTGGKNILNVVFDPNKKEGLLLATTYGLIKTDDGGKTWKELQLLSLPGTTKIYSVAINPRNSKEIYYGTNGTIYKTIDGGTTWITKKMPTSSAIKILLIDPKTPATIYAGISKEN
ncbi:MAG: YCF48-related protein [Patescibacteria group bacterium]